jgi:transcriptional regulator with XRE-family HTH domain
VNSTIEEKTVPKKKSMYRNSPIDPKAMGGRMRQIRKDHKMSIRSLAKQLGISFSLLGFYERGDRRVPINMLYEVSRLGGVSIDWLVTGQEIRNGKRKKTR